MYRIARDTLQSVGKWQLRTYQEFARIKAAEPMDPFVAASNMAAQFIPFVSGYIDEGGKFVRTELGLQDADDWLVRNPDAIRSVRTAAFDLCQETIDNFLADGNAEVDRLREEAARAISRGETAGDLVDRMSQWFNEESRWRARRIANTESARAFNAGQVMATRDLDFIAGYEWILDGDACPLCHAVKRQCPKIPKDGTFAVNGKNQTYRNVRFPPLHPGCRCTIVTVFDDEVPDEWPATVMPGESGYVVPSEADKIAARDGGYESVQIGNAKSVTGFVAMWE